MTRTIKATPNHKKRTFTIRIFWADGSKGSKYRTNKMSKEDFQNEMNNTNHDWETFLRYSNDYFLIN